MKIYYRLQIPVYIRQESGWHILNSGVAKAKPVCTLLDMLTSIEPLSFSLVLQGDNPRRKLQAMFQPEIDILRNEEIVK